MSDFDEPTPNRPEPDWFRFRTVDTSALDGAESATPDGPASSDGFTAVTVEAYVPPRATPYPPLRARRRARKRSAPRMWVSTLRAILVVMAAALLVSTIFSMWTRPTFFSDEFRAGLGRVQATQRLISIQPTVLPTYVREVRIGIIAGHSGPPEDPTFTVDPGAVCPDGLTELEINEAVAWRVVTLLRRDGYTVDLFNEFDPQLENYQANALVSIHTNDCGDYGAAGTGYNAAAASARRTTRGADERLLDCLIGQYGATTGLPRHYGVTLDMTEYHNFGEVSTDTPTAIIEIGYMRNDRQILTQNPDLIAQGIANGLRCFLRPDLYSAPPSASQ